MENKNYYDILGVSVKATMDEITAAKNLLAKRYHPDVNIKLGVDTTEQMQKILEAYRILSDLKKRSEYDREITGRTAVMQTFDLRNEDEPAEDSAPTFVTYWKAASALYDIIIESDSLFKEKDRSGRLAQLSMQAIKYVILLRGADIPEKYWHPDIMNWLLFTWYKNRNLTIAYLLTLYDDYVKEKVSVVKKLRLQKNACHFQRSVKRLVKY